MELRMGITNILHKTQDEIIGPLGIECTAYFCTKKLFDLIPERQEKVESGNISTFIAFCDLALLSEEDQAAVYASLPKDVKFSSKDVRTHVDEQLYEKKEK